MKKIRPVDPGIYNRDQNQYTKIINQIYQEFPTGITLPPEYNYFIQNDMSKLLIRLARYKFVAKMIKSNDTVLEVGSGSGLGSIFLSQYCHHVIGLDVKTTEVEEANKINKRENVEFIIKDLFDLEIKQQYDVVVALDVIEHFSEKQGKMLIEKMSRHVNPNGMLIIGTPSIYSYPYQGKLSQASHIKCYNEKELADLIETFFSRTLMFSMNDELVHTGNPRMAWYYFVIGLYQKV